jgi:acetyl esterase/lipase
MMGVEKADMLNTSIDHHHGGEPRFNLQSVPKATGLFWLLALPPLMAMSGCTRFAMLNAFVPPWGYTRTTNIAYGTSPRQTLDVYRPCARAPAANIVIFFYGGDLQRGTKADYCFVAQALTSRGFIAVLPDYRLYPDVTFPAFVDDGALAVRWVHDHAREIGGDPHHVYLMGHSAGAYIAVMLTLDAQYLNRVGLDRSSIRATASISGPFNFVPPPEDRCVFGMAPDDTRPDPRIEPINFVDGHAPPILLLQGLKDPEVDPANATELAALIRKKGGEVVYIGYPDRAHVGMVLALAYPFRWLAPVLHDTVKFFHDHQ